MTFAQACVAWALRRLGDPYIWAGEGEWCVRGPVGAGQILSVAEVGCPGYGFDCAGLVKRAALAANPQGPDLRGPWGAQHLFWHLPEAREGDIRLVFYGVGDVASHVGFDLGNHLVLEASGGDATTLTYANALHRNAKVRIGFEQRPDRIGYRSLEAVAGLPKQPPPRPPPATPTLPTPRL